MNNTTTSLEDQRTEYSNSPFLLISPLARQYVWLIIGTSITTIRSNHYRTLLIGTNSIAYLGMFFSKYTGENFPDKKNKNTFNALFLFTAGQSFLVYTIVILFFLQDYTLWNQSVNLGAQTQFFSPD